MQYLGGVCMPGATRFFTKSRRSLLIAEYFRFMIDHLNILLVLVMQW